MSTYTSVDLVPNHDITLVFEDTARNVHPMRCHRAILCNYSEFFHKLLDSSFIESTQHDVPMKVRSIPASIDVVSEIYRIKCNTGNMPEWEHQLEMILCKKYWQLPIDLTVLDKLDIPITGFNLLLVVSEHFHHEEPVLSAVIRVLSRLSTDQIRKCLKHSPSDLLSKLHTMPNNNRIVSYDAAHNINIWNTGSGQSVRLLYKDVGSFSLRPNTQQIAVINGKLVHMTSIDHPKIISSEQSHTAKMVQFDPTGTEMAFLSGGCCSMYIITVDAETNTKRWQSQRVSAETSVAYSPNGTYVAYTNIATIMLLGLKTKMHAKQFLEAANVSHIQFSADSGSIVFAIDKKVCVRNIVDASYYQLTEHTKSINAIAVSPDNQHIASSSDQIRIWNCTTKECVFTLSHRGTVNALCYSSTGRLLASGSSDTTIKIWNGYTGQLLFTFFNQHAVLKLQFTSGLEYELSKLIEERIRLNLSVAYIV